MLRALESGLSANDFSWKRLDDEELEKVKVLYRKVGNMKVLGNKLRDTDGKPLPEHLQPSMAYNTLSLKPGLVEYVGGKTEKFSAVNADAGQIRMLFKAYHI